MFSERRKRKEKHSTKKKANTHTRSLNWVRWIQSCIGKMLNSSRMAKARVRNVVIAMYLFVCYIFVHKQRCGVSVNPYRIQKRKTIRDDIIINIINRNRCFFFFFLLHGWYLWFLPCCCWGKCFSKYQKLQRKKNLNGPRLDVYMRWQKAAQIPTKKAIISRKSF